MPQKALRHLYRGPKVIAPPRSFSQPSLPDLYRGPKVIAPPRSFSQPSLPDLLGLAQNLSFSWYADKSRNPCPETLNAMAFSNFLRLHSRAWSIAARMA